MFVSNSGLAGKQHALTNESGASERLRMEHIKKERDRIEKDCAKTQLSDKKRIHDQHKLDMQHREIELHRLQSEATRAKVDLDQYKGISDEEDQKIIKLKQDVKTVSDRIQKLTLELVQLRNQSDKLSVQLSHELSQKEYKKKLFESKENAFHEAEERKKRQAFEIERVRGESVRLESEIKILEQKAR